MYIGLEVICSQYGRLHHFWSTSPESHVFWQRIRHLFTGQSRWSVHNMVDSHSRLLLLLVNLQHILLVLVTLDILTCTVDSSHLFSHTLLHLGRLALNICSQYGRLFCSLLVLAYFLLHLGRLALDIVYAQYGRLILLMVDSLDSH